MGEGGAKIPNAYRLPIRIFSNCKPANSHFELRLGCFWPVLRCIWNHTSCPWDSWRRRHSQSAFYPWWFWERTQHVWQRDPTHSRARLHLNNLALVCLLLSCWRFLASDWCLDRTRLPPLKHAHYVREMKHTCTDLEFTSLIIWHDQNWKAWIHTLEMLNQTVRIFHSCE